MKSYVGVKKKLSERFAHKLNAEKVDCRCVLISAQRRIIAKGIVAAVDAALWIFIFVKEYVRSH